MLRRLLSALLGGIVGIVLAWGFQDSLSLSITWACVSFTLAGMGLGYVASMLFDVFAGTPSGPPQ
ncbi:MAG TPA: hypothetical protein VLM42_14625 [Bryobacteraceae bacterium]|nr:hypothetical protein [Bryobacteraceae bacterium]